MLNLGRPKNILLLSILLLLALVLSMFESSGGGFVRLEQSFQVFFGPFYLVTAIVKSARRMRLEKKNPGAELPENAAHLFLLAAAVMMGVRFFNRAIMATPLYGALEMASILLVLGATLAPWVVLLVGKKYKNLRGHGLRLLGILLLTPFAIMIFVELVDQFSLPVTIAGIALVWFAVLKLSKKALLYTIIACFAGGAALVAAHAWVKAPYFIANKSSGTQGFEATNAALMPLAEKGDAHAMFLIGENHAHPSNPQRDAARALEWHLKAAEHGHDEAAAFLGNAYLFGQDGAEKKPAEAMKWLGIAAKSGDAYSQLLLGRIYLENAKDDTDRRDKGLAWLNRAAKQGRFDAYRALYKHHKTGPDFAEAYFWFLLLRDHEMNSFLRSCPTVERPESSIFAFRAAAEIRECEDRDIRDRLTPDELSRIKLRYRLWHPADERFWKKLLP